MGRWRPGEDRAERRPSPRWGGGIEVVRPPPSDSGTQCSRPGLALPCPPRRLFSGAGGRVRSGPRGPLGGEAPDKGGAGAGAGGGVGEGSGSEPPPRGAGDRAGLCPGDCGGRGDRREELRHWLTIPVSDRLAVLERVGSSQWGRGGGVHAVGLASGDPVAGLAQETVR